MIPAREADPGPQLNLGSAGTIASVRASLKPRWRHGLNPRRRRGGGGLEWPSRSRDFGIRIGPDFNRGKFRRHDGASHAAQQFASEWRL